VSFVRNAAVFGIVCWPQPVYGPTVVSYVNVFGESPTQTVPRVPAIVSVTFTHSSTWFTVADAKLYGASTCRKPAGSLTVALTCASPGFAFGSAIWKAQLRPAVSVTGNGDGLQPIVPAISGPNMSGGVANALTPPIVIDGSLENVALPLTPQLLSVEPVLVTVTVYSTVALSPALSVSVGEPTDFAIVHVWVRLSSGCTVMSTVQPSADGVTASVLTNPAASAISAAIFLVLRNMFLSLPSPTRRRSVSARLSRA
jgi:hypothetical protein